jgi:hypothetical protein
VQGLLKRGGAIRVASSKSPLVWGVRLCDEYSKAEVKDKKVVEMKIYEGKGSLNKRDLSLDFKLAQGTDHT